MTGRLVKAPSRRTRSRLKGRFGSATGVSSAVGAVGAPPSPSPSLGSPTSPASPPSPPAHGSGGGGGGAGLPRPLPLLLSLPRAFATGSAFWSRGPSTSPHAPSSAMPTPV